MQIDIRSPVAVRFGAVGLLLVGCGALGAATPTIMAPPSIEAFAARQTVEGVAVSPDGRYLAMIETAEDHAGVFVQERVGGHAPPTGGERTRRL